MKQYQEQPQNGLPFLQVIMQVSLSPSSIQLIHFPDKNNFKEKYFSHIVFINGLNGVKSNGSVQRSGQDVGCEKPCFWATRFDSPLSTGIIIIGLDIVTVRWRLARPGHLWVCERKNEPCSFSRGLVSWLNVWL